MISVSSPFPTRRLTTASTVVDIIVSWSEPLAVACGADNDGWVPLPLPPPQDRTSPPVALLRYTCPLITLTLSLGAVLNAPLVAAAPSAWPPPPGACNAAEAATLRFRYTTQRGDSSASKPLQYTGQGAMQLTGGSRIVRAIDGAAAGTALPPTHFDLGAGGDHVASLAGMRQIVVAIPP